LEKGLGAGTKFLGVAYPQLRAEAKDDPHAVPIPAGATTPISFLTAPGAWDRLVELHPDARVLVSLIGVPADLAQSRVWTASDGPVFALLLPDLRLVGDRAAVRSAFQQGRIIAAALTRPGAPPESAAMRTDRQGEFDLRYLLATPANIDELMEAWPQLFPP
jgi:hypothetical protein